ncbi:MAG: hypothetical protein HZC40_11685 [Chloroflexi bacterium]|nr:hypothetical protein [Chloroflexota bacterium]
MTSISVEPVESRAQLEEFIRFPFWLYRDDPAWVPPLLRARRKLFEPRHNPFFDHAEVALFLARRAGKIVGAISAQIDRRHNEAHNARVGHFGFFETIDDAAVTDHLLATARDWVRARGMTTLRGPLDFTRENSCGVLIETDGKPPSVMTTHNPPYYAARCERFGLHKAMDSLAYRLDLTQFTRVDAPTAPFAQIAQSAAQTSRVTIRASRRAIFRQDILRAKNVFHAAFAPNWDFTPFTDAEFERAAHQLAQIGDPAFAISAEADGALIGVAMAIPDAHQILKQLNGRLFPFGWLKAIQLERARAITQLRFLMIGVLENYRQQGIELRMFLEILKTAVAKKYRALEFACVLENNAKVNLMLQYWGKPYDLRVVRTYRIYEMAI